MRMFVDFGFICFRFSKLFCCGVNTVNGYKDYGTLEGERRRKGQAVKGAAFWRNSYLTSKESRLLVTHKRYGKSETNSV